MLCYFPSPSFSLIFCIYWLSIWAPEHWLRNLELDSFVCLKLLLLLVDRPSNSRQSPRCKPSTLWEVTQVSGTCCQTREVCETVRRKHSDSQTGTSGHSTTAQAGGKETSWRTHQVHIPHHRSYTSIKEVSWFSLLLLLWHISFQILLLLFHFDTNFSYVKFSMIKKGSTRGGKMQQINQAWKRYNMAYFCFSEEEDSMEDTVTSAIAEASHTAFVRGRWVFSDCSGELHHCIVAPTLPVSGDYSAYSMWGEWADLIFIVIIIFICKIKIMLYSQAVHYVYSAG